MSRFYFSCLLFFSCYFFLNAQNLDYSILGLSKELTENANACVRNQEVLVTINSQKSMTITTKRVVTVFNEYGQRHIDAYQGYDNSQKIISIEAQVFNQTGTEIKKFKRKDFKDQSVADGFSIFTDSRVLYLDYTPTQYPFTVVYTSVVETPNTAFIPGWYPFENYFLSVQNSSVKVNFPTNLGFKYKEYNFEGYTVQKEANNNSVAFKATNLQALKREDYAPSISKFTPSVLFGMDKFHLEGIDGEAHDWSKFGKWRFDKLIVGTDELPQETKNKIISLVGDEKDDLEKAKIVYKYVQDKTRYVSIQLGIGGWKPMLVKDVDRLGYGDCKALTNYTRSLLNAVGVESYYTVIYAGKDKIDFKDDFVSMQGNHIILGLPYKGSICWLECTSQILPFGFLGDFTDDRLALMVKPDGGEIVRTAQYSDKNNSQLTKGNYTILSDGSLSGKVNIKSKGTQYDSKYTLERRSQKDLEEHYNNYFFAIKNLKYEKLNYLNDKESIEFTEELKIEGSNYASKSGSNLIFALNAFNQYNKVPTRYRTRLTPFEVSRGFFDSDEIIITIPEGYSIDSKPDNFEIKEKFGHYKTEVKVVNNQVTYKRDFTMNDGFYEKADYENFRKFTEQIARNDNAKIVLLKN
jgi:transglutaminase-like putative cysteine protease